MSKNRRHRRHLRDGDSLTIKEFCDKHGIARATYYKLRKTGDGPAEIDILGTVRIPACANSEWLERKKKERAARLPVFPKSSDPDEESRGDKAVSELQKKRSKKRGRDPASESVGPGDDKHSDDDRANPRRKEGRSNERGRDAAPKSSRRDKDRDDNKTSPRRQKKRWKESGHGEKRCADDETTRRRKRRRSKERQRGRSEKAPSKDVRPEPPVDLADLKRRLKRGKRLPKDALIESRRWRLPTNPHRNRDRQIERAMLQALTGPGSSEAEHQHAIEQANCTPEAPCGRLMCWLCKHRTWFKLRRKVADVLDQKVPPDHISWVTVVIDVCEPSPNALREPMSEFRSWLTKAAEKWGVVFFGRFEIDLLLDPQVERHKATVKRNTLLWLGLDPERSEPVAVFHVHLIAHHPDKGRSWLSVPLKQSFKGPQQTKVEPFYTTQSQTQALDNLTRYPLKSLPPKGALLKESRSYRPRDPKALRLYYKLASFLDGENGECIAKPDDPREHT
jgi:predicted DNA-binding transcriptional regulator AlpA